MNSNYDPMVHYMTDDDETDSPDSKSTNGSEVEYHFDGFEVEINIKRALTPINVKPQV